jgi:2-keto-4-pentenoate hydratase/2-oxohepta-3-ene-1,7-dioic acid hydratase in catechol pathway
MRLITYRLPTDPERLEHVGALLGDEVVEVSGATARPAGDGGGGAPLPASLLELLRSEHGLQRAQAVAEAAERTAEQRVALASVELLAPLPRPNSLRDFMLVEEHVLNSFGEVPPEWYSIPVYWKGNPDTVLGPEATVPWPYYTEKLDYELEVGAVIGRPTSRVSVAEAETSIAGYTIFNDWSARDIQFREMSVSLGPGLSKDFATSLGPCVTTADAIDIGSARMTARVNGEVWSEGTLGAMRFSFAEVISHLSQEQTLQPGDVLGSGTVGRGCGLELDRWIAPGDVVELEVEGIGVLRNTVGARHEEPPPGSGVASVAAHLS